jgi:hypothetical protein
MTNFLYPLPTRLRGERVKGGHNSPLIATWYKSVVFHRRQSVKTPGEARNRASLFSRREKSMGQFYQNHREALGFPDEFGEDIYQEGQRDPQEKSQMNAPTPYFGYVTTTWFGPFLLSPLNRRERGWC